MTTTYLLIPAAAVALFAIETFRIPFDVEGEEPEDVACRLIEGAENTWGAIGGREGMKTLYRSAVDMLRVVTNNPSLPRTRNELLLMCACLYVVSRWCLYVEAPLKRIFSRMPRRAAWASARIYCDMAATYTVAMEG